MFAFNNTPFIFPNCFQSTKFEEILSLGQGTLCRNFILYTLNLVVQLLEAIVQVILLPTMDYKCIGYEFYRFLST